MTIDIVTADLECGVTEVIKHSSTHHYDAIISRGATAKAIRRNTSIPVVEFPLSVYDILRSIKLTEHSSGEIAIVGFSDITSNAKLLCELLQYDIDIFPITRKEEIPPILESLKDKNYNFILCDASTQAIAKKD